MKTIPFEFGAGSLVWVWDSTWLPAKIVRVDQMNRLLVRLDHGVTFSVTNEDVRVRDFDRRVNDLPPRFF